MASPSDDDRDVAAVQPVYVIARERSIPCFYGKETGDGRTAEEFAASIRRCWSGQHLSKAGRLDVLYHNLGPLVKDELRCQSPAVQEDPDKALEKIVEIFGERRTTSELAQVLQTIRQESGERCRNYSHRCQRAFLVLRHRQEVLRRPSQKTGFSGIIS